MESEAPPADPLRAFLSGKREHRRHPVSLPVELSGAQFTFSGRCLDVSEGGALIAVPEVSLERAIREESDDYLHILGRELGDGFDLRFVHHDVVLEAAIVRLSVPPGQAGLLYLGCRFLAALGNQQRARLGLGGEPAAGAEVDAPWLEAAPLERLPMSVRPGCAASVLIYDGAPTVSGPRFAGTITGRGDRALGVEIAGLEPAEVSARLGTEAFRIHVVSGGTTIWVTEATLIAARYMDTPEGGVEVALLANERVPRKARKLFQKRA